MTLPARVCLALSIIISGQTLAQGSAPSPAPLSERAAKRFPQPVRVGDLVGRKVLEPKPSQPVLGHVAGLVRSPDGAPGVVVRLGSWFGLGGRAVAVPVEAVALLGEHVALLDLTPEQLRALPDLDPGRVRDFPPDESIRVGLARPFH